MPIFNKETKYGSALLTARQVMRVEGVFLRLFPYWGSFYPHKEIKVYLDNT